MVVMEDSSHSDESSFDNLSSSSDSSDTVGTGDLLDRPQERDEVKEVRKKAAKDTGLVRVWRLIVAAVLVATALLITLSTLNSLQDEEQAKFERAFQQFAATVTASFEEYEADARSSYSSMASVVSTAARVSNATWPFFTFPRFESIAANSRYQTKSEIVNLINLVKDEDKDEWLDYAAGRYKGWVTEGYEIESKREGPQVYDNFEAKGYHDYLTKVTPNKDFVPQDSKEDHWVSWMYSPPPNTYSFINWDYDSEEDYRLIIDAAVQLQDQTLWTRVRQYVSNNVAFTQEEHEAKHTGSLAEDAAELPHAMVFHPVHVDPDDDKSDVVAMVLAGMAWDAPLVNLLPEEAKGLVVVVANSCNQSYSFELNGPRAVFLGEGDKHDPKYNNMEVVSDLSESSSEEYKKTEGHCLYTVHVYPSSHFEDSWTSAKPQTTAAMIAVVFAIVIILFFVYDMFVQRRNEKLIANAARTNALVSSLFPGTLRDKVIEQENATSRGHSGHGNLRAFMSDGKQLPEAKGFATAPMADLFLETTIMFADIVGFTAWSSTREPAHVFTLLETMYSSFDEIAKARRVFKVETVGDCYVAATGMPDPTKHHAVQMCRFAKDIMKKMRQLTKELEVTLGPDTGDLSLRVGIHSGPVTAGVLRGEKARFQLFGDTMNTTARIESGGMPERIHLSEETAEILIESGKEHWLEKRETMIEAKGKGRIQTYWLAQGAAHASSSRGSDESSSNMGDDIMMDAENVDAAKIQRLIEWNVESLLRILKLIVAEREASGRKPPADNSCMEAFESYTLETDSCFLDEVKEIVELPEFDSSGALKERKRPEEINIDEEVVDQLRTYVTCIASMYRSNSFHNFEHASHVSMSVLKLLARIVAPSELDEVDEDMEMGQAAIMHDHTYGITSDPIVQFGCAFSALIHDADHSGAPNAQLIKENAPVAAAYNNRSVAEQNSLALAWNLLMDDQFKDLRGIIYIDSTELERFRAIVVNAVMATDIVDKELKALRNARWEKAFSKEEGTRPEAETREDINRKATIVIEHLIQASDISHTMQHWHIYRKWNERFFRECYIGWRNGRAEKNPADGWYTGEIGFFDFYIIPLAKKLKNCGVFGKSSDEYLNYAQRNRAEWESKGQQVVAEMIESIEKEIGPPKTGKRRQSLRG